MAQRKLTKQQIADQWYESLKASGEAIIWDKHLRDRFRETTAWKRFVKRIKRHVCEFCTCKSKGTTIHHLYPMAYDDLRPELFAELCWSDHTKISQLSRRKDKSTIPEYFMRFIERDGLPGAESD
jgi:hypothetical protein